MPFGGLFKKDKSATTMSSKEQRSKLGLKVVMAQQNPEPVYDLSDCGMVEMPPDTFCMCKLLQKTTLLLQNNSLTSLEKGGKLHELENLEVLDLSHNKFSHLPDCMNKMKKLKILNLGNNKLKSLPSLLGDLSHLQELDLSYNKFSKVPHCICALPKLRLLNLCGNSISVLPKEMCQLQKSLQTLNLDENIKLKSPSADVLAAGVETVMRELCEEHGVEYVGLSESLADSPECASPRSITDQDQSVADEVLHNIMSRKNEKMKAHMAAEEEFQAREQEQLASMLKDMSNNKAHLLEGISQTPVEALDYERKKLALMQEKYNIEESMRAEQAEQLEKYFAVAYDKEALLNDLTTQQANLDIEVEGLVTAKEKERQTLLKDISNAEQETGAAVQELVAASSHRSEGFVSLLQDQEKEMQSLLSGLADSSAELRRTEVIAAMQSVLMEEAAAERRRQAFQEEQGARVGALLQEADLANSHLKGILTTRMADQEAWVTTLMNDELCQAAAFKILLMKSDLKRNNILRQIGQIEYELARLSWLEVRKKKFGVKYGSTTMLKQRSTLAELLKSLLEAKTEREDQLDNWLGKLKDMRGSDMDEEEFWLIQYQRLLSMKPAGLAEAEEKLEPQVRAVLKAAHALDLTPVFAHNSITFSRLIDMTEEEASTLGIGPATYRSLQRALQNILSSSKLGDQKPSAPCEEDLPYSPSAPPDSSSAAAPSAPVLESEGATAPPQEEQFVEAECVVCLSTGCEVVFLPCGHVCVCAKCCTPLVICPLCRAPLINTKNPGKKKMKFLKIVKDRNKTEGNDSGLASTEKKRKRKKKEKLNRPYEGVPGIELAKSLEGKTEAATKRLKIKRKNAPSAETTERKDDTDIDGEANNVDKSQNKNETGVTKKGKNKKNKKKYVLFIGNLPYETEEGEVREHFKLVKDDITRVTLLTDSTTGRSKGCGFIELSTPKAYQEALKLNLSKVGDHKIRVEFTVPGKKNSNKRNKFIKMKTKKILGQSKKGKKKKNKS